MAYEGWKNVTGVAVEKVNNSLDLIEDEQVRELLTGITSARLATLEDVFQRQTGGNFALLNKEVTDNVAVFQALRELGVAHTEAEQDIAMASLIELVNEEADQTDMAA